MHYSDDDRVVIVVVVVWFCAECFHFMFYQLTVASKDVLSSLGAQTDRSALTWDKFEILTTSTVRRANMHRHAKFRIHRSNRCQDMAVCPCFKMAAVRHLGFLNVRTFDCLTLRRANVRHWAKFHAHRSSLYLFIYNDVVHVYTRIRNIKKTNKQTNTQQAIRLRHTQRFNNKINVRSI